jgi:hypothetical protein
MPVNRVKRHGSFAPLSVNYYDDDKIIAAGEKAEVLFTRGLAFCARTLSDGFITDLQLTTFRLPGVKQRANKLVAVGLWLRVEGDGLFGDTGSGYRVVQWTKWNNTKAEIEDKQHRDAQRKRPTEGKRTA